MALQMKKTASHSSNDARWEDYDKDTKVLIKPADDESYQIALERMRRRLARNDDRFGEGAIGVIAGERSEYENHCMIVASFLLKDWQGALDENGSAIPYTEAVGAEMMRGNTDFFLFVLRRAAALAAENKGELAEIEGKPSPATGGKPSGAAKPRKKAGSTKS